MKETTSFIGCAGVKRRKTIKQKLFARLVEVTFEHNKAKQKKRKI